MKNITPMQLPEEKLELHMNFRNRLRRQTGIPGFHFVPSILSPMPAVLTSPSAVIFVTTALAVVYFRPIKVLFASLWLH